jgi:5-methylthioadenosine/S-adenosylhomocysteine deaminase
VGVNEENLVNYIVYAGSSADIRGTMVNGRWLYRDGAYLTLDRDRVLAKAREARKAITA